MTQTTIFDLLYEDYKITKPIRLIELFAGVGSQAMALRNIGANFEHYRICEFDKYAVQSYNAIHGTDFPTSDISKIAAEDLGVVDTDNYEYIMTYSFPCTDLSVAGKMQGMARDSGTRSGLLWQVERLLNEMTELPQILLMENVPQVISADNIKHFNEWQDFLVSKGYSNYTEVLNAKDYGVAQNRNRCFMVSILGEWNYHFPQKKVLTKTIKDYLEDEVDEKFYISNEKADKLIEQLIKDGKYQEKHKPKENQIASAIRSREFEGCGFKEECPTLCARDYKDPKVVAVKQNRIGGLFDREVECECDGEKWTETRRHQAGSVWDKEGLAPSIDTMQGGCREPIIVDSVQIKQATKDKYIECKIGGVADLSYPNSDTRRGRVQDNGNTCPTITATETGICKIELPQACEIREDEGIRFFNDNCCGTLRTINACGDKHAIEPSLKLRKLTPKECWRLMAFTDGDFEKAENVCSNSQLYKQAGNSIVVNVLEEIFKQLM